MNHALLRLAVLALLLLTGSAGAQFNLNSWMNFEEGKLPDGTLLLHDARPTNVRVVEYAQLGKSEMLAGPAAQECGRYGLELKSGPKQRYLCVASPARLQRSRLGANGRALFQADIYLDGQTNLGHTMAVVALGVDPTKPPKQGDNFWKLYRLGALAAEKAFFSFTDGSPSPKIYLHEKIVEIVPAGTKGWHRFQFVIEGQAGISCYVDGVRTSYSPIEEGTLQVLQPGILVTAPADVPITAYVDNLSIQWTMDPTTPMPQSPWVSQEVLSGTEDARVLWYTDFRVAVSESRRTKKPLLVLFYIPGNLAFQELSNNIFQNSEEARSYLGQVVPVRVDANQLQGSNLARRYTVRRIPSFVVLEPDGREKGRFEMLKGERWRDINPKLKGILDPKGAAAAPASP